MRAQARARFVAFVRRQDEVVRQQGLQPRTPGRSQIRRLLAQAADAGGGGLVAHVGGEDDLHLAVGHAPGDAAGDRPGQIGRRVIHGLARLALGVMQIEVAAVGREPVAAAHGDGQPVGMGRVGRLIQGILPAGAQHAVGPAHLVGGLAHAPQKAHVDARDHREGTPGARRRRSRGSRSRCRRAARSRSGVTSPGK